MSWLFFLKEILYHPIKIFWMSAVICFVVMLSDGSFWNWWSLRRNYNEMHSRLSEIEAESLELEHRIQAAEGREFIERQATEQLGLVRENDLVFVFPDGE